MFCSQCGSQQSDELRFCKLCGASLRSIQLTSPETGFDWSKTWVTEMFLSSGERKRRDEEIERQRGITPEMKRYQEIKAGVITSFVGIGVAIVLFVLMEGIIMGGKVTPGTAEILSRLWVAGVIPFLVGLAVMINGLFVSKRLAALKERQNQTNSFERESEVKPLSPADTSEFIPSGFSVTEETTRHLSNSRPKKV